MVQLAMQNWPKPIEPSAAPAATVSAATLETLIRSLIISRVTIDEKVGVIAGTILDAYNKGLVDGRVQ